MNNNIELNKTVYNETGDDQPSHARMCDSNGSLNGDECHLLANVSLIKKVKSVIMLESGVRVNDGKTSSESESSRTVYDTLIENKLPSEEFLSCNICNLKFCECDVLDLTFHVPEKIIGRKIYCGGCFMVLERCSCKSKVKIMTLKKVHANIQILTQQLLNKDRYIQKFIFSCNNIIYNFIDSLSIDVWKTRKPFTITPSYEKDWYWVIDGKPYHDHKAVQAMIKMGYTAYVRYGLPGGMYNRRQNKNYHAKNKKKDINEAIGENRGIPLLVLGNNNNRENVYFTNTPLFFKDPSHKESKVNVLEQNIAFLEHTNKNQYPINCWNKIYNTVNPRYIHDKINVCTHLNVEEFVCYMPEYSVFNSDGSVIMRTLNDRILMRFKIGGSNVKLIVPSDVEIDERNAQFGLVSWIKLNNAIVQPLEEFPFTIISDLKIPNQIIDYGLDLLAGRTISLYVMNSFKADYNNWLKRMSFNDLYNLPDDLSEQVYAIYADKTSSSKRNVMPGVRRDLTSQLQTTREFQDPMDPTPNKSLLKSLMDMVFPEPVSRFLKTKLEQLSRLNLKKELKQLIDNFLSSLNLDSFCLMLSFSGLQPWMSVILEELIKTIPLGSIPIFIYEIYRDCKSGTFSYWKLTTRFTFHCFWEFLPDSFLFSFRLLSLPFRLLFHFLWNAVVKYVKIRRPQRLNEIATLEYIQSQQYIGSRKKIITTPIDHTEYENKIQPFSGWIQRKESQNQPYMNIDFVPKPILDSIAFYNPPMTYYYSGLLHLTDLSFPVKCEKNFLQAITKRNYQPYPIPKIKDFVLEDINKLLISWTYGMQQEYYTPIDHANRSPKKNIYLKALQIMQDDDKNLKYGWEMFLKTNEAVRGEYRVIFSADPTYMALVGNMFFAAEQWVKKELLNGERSLSKLVPIRILYSAVHVDQVASFFTNYLYSRTYAAACLGDDNSTVQGSNFLAIDQRRFDSTQHESLRFLIDKIYDKKMYSREYRIFLRQRISSQKYKVKATGDYVQMPEPNGLKTGTRETSISNTMLTALAVTKGIENNPNDWENSIMTLMEDDLGWLPKSNVGSIYNGMEFLKKIFVPHESTYRVVPLLSNFKALIKAEKDPRTIVPGSKNKPQNLIIINQMYMTLNSMFQRNTLCYVDELFSFYDKYRYVGKEQKMDWRAAKLEENSKTIVPKELATHVWGHRYGINEKQIENFFSVLKPDVSKLPYHFHNEIWEYVLLHDS